MTDKSNSINKLIGMISEYAGLKESELLKRKLDFILKGLSAEHLEEWIKSIEMDPYKQELPALVEDLNNHETYFFRDPAQMKALEDKIIPELIKSKMESGDHNIKIWSAACSSGEEAYTLAMLLLKTFIDLNLSVKLPNGMILPPQGWNIEILGTDISRQVVRKAKEGLYEASDTGLSSFRGFPEEYMHFFNLVKEFEDTLGNKKRTYCVNDLLKTFVNFETFNLVNPLPPSTGFDLVLCRNLLIYLNPEAQTQVELVIRNALKPGGIFHVKCC